METQCFDVERQPTEMLVFNNLEVHEITMADVKAVDLNETKKTNSLVRILAEISKITYNCLTAISFFDNIYCTGTIPVE